MRGGGGCGGMMMGCKICSFFGWVGDSIFVIM